MDPRQTTVVKLRQSGMANLKLLVTIPMFVVGVFLAFKFGVAAIDVFGFEKDLEKNMPEMSYSCVAAACEDDLFDEIEAIIKLHQRNVKIYWDAIDWVMESNELLVPGYTEVDLLVTKVRWVFEHRIQYLR